MSEDSQLVQAPCSSCLRRTSHEVLHAVEAYDDDIREEYALVRCRGCGQPSLQVSMFDKTEDDWLEPTYFPSPMIRRLPFWVLQMRFDFTPSGQRGHLGRLLTEVYEAVRAGHYRLAAMGIRAALETTMINEVGDHGGFEKNMKEFHAKGYISLVALESMQVIIDIGHATIHRSHAPSEADLKVALDVLEGILAPIYSHKRATETLAVKTPKRAARKPKTP